MSALEPFLTAEAIAKRTESPLPPRHVLLASASLAPTPNDHELASAMRRIDVVTSIVGGWVWETDAEHRFVYMSPSVARYAGKDPEWHYGKTRQQLGNLNVKTADGGDWTKQLDERQSFGPVDFVRYQDGNTLHMRTIGHPQFDDGGRFTGHIGIAFEISPDTEAEPAERRQAPRQRMVRAAEIALATEGTSIACVLADISTTGARLRLPLDTAVAGEIELHVPGLSMRKRCTVRWRKANEIGVEFV